MNNSFKKYFSVFLTVLMLASPQAYSLYKHTCLITNKSSVSLDIKDCSGNQLPTSSDSKPQFKRSSCCDIQHITIKNQNQKAPNLTFDFGHFDIDFISRFIFFEGEKTFISHFNSKNLSKPTFYTPPIYILKNEFLI